MIFTAPRRGRSPRPNPAPRRSPRSKPRAAGALLATNDNPPAWREQLRGDLRVIMGSAGLAIAAVAAIWLGQHWPAIAAFLQLGGR